jgi:hypothetical protein
MQTNQLRLEQTFGQTIKATAKDLDYQNQPKLRRHIFDCYDLLSAKCQKIDIGCKNQDEMYELEFLRSKVIGAATEPAELLGIIENSSYCKLFQKKEGLTNDEWITFAHAADCLKPAS